MDNWLTLSQTVSGVITNCQEDEISKSGSDVTMALGRVLENNYARFGRRV